MAIEKKFENNRKKERDTTEDLYFLGGMEFLAGLAGGAVALGLVPNHPHLAEYVLEASTALQLASFATCFVAQYNKQKQEKEYKI